MRAAWLCVLLAACTTQTKPPPPCGAGGALIADIEYRDPQTGQCQSFGYPCDPACGQACPETGTGAVGSQQPDWGMCGGACEGLPEAQCLASASCHAAYQDDPSALRPVFWGCWELPPSGARTGSCSGLDAQTCSEHADCASQYTSPVNQPPNFIPSFESCVAEPGTGLCENIDCAGECVVTPAMPATPQCQPIATAGTCAAPTCSNPPPGCPTGTTPGVGSNGCFTNYCIPSSECAPAACSTLATETECKARPDCDAVYMGSNCTCDNNGCVCQTLTYLNCQ
jgi:hypothetical protein